MSQPPIIAYHIIWGAYGFWLPNDPRGSWSDYVWAPRLRPFGEATKVTARRSHAHDGHDRRLRLEAKEELTYPTVRFTAEQIESIARGFADIREKLKLVLYAAALMPDHVHIVVPRQSYQAEELCGIYKRAASRQLRKDGVHPLAAYARAKPRLIGSSTAGASGPADTLPTPWAELGWKVYLHSAEEIWPAIRYAERNPTVARLPAQRWDFVTTYDGG